MKLYDGRYYNDDRIFVLEMTRAKKGKTDVWAVITRRNCQGYPPFRVDDFQTRDEALNFAKRIEPTTPLVSLGGNSPQTPLPYEEYRRSLTAQGMQSCLDLPDTRAPGMPEVVIEEVNPRDCEAGSSGR
jgi:hypothetical protein